MPSMLAGCRTHDACRCHLCLPDSAGGPQLPPYRRALPDPVCVRVMGLMTADADDVVEVVHAEAARLQVPTKPEWVFGDQQVTAGPDAACLLPSFLPDGVLSVLL